MKDNSATTIIVPESHSETDFDITTINATSDSFNFLKDQEEIYSASDVTKRYS